MAFSRIYYFQARAFQVDGCKLHIALWIDAQVLNWKLIWHVTCVRTVIEFIQNFIKRFTLINLKLKHISSTCWNTRSKLKCKSFWIFSMQLFFDIRLRIHPASQKSIFELEYCPNGTFPAYHLQGTKLIAWVLTSAKLMIQINYGRTKPGTSDWILYLVSKSECNPLSAMYAKHLIRRSFRISECQSNFNYLIDN